MNTYYFTATKLIDFIKISKPHYSNKVNFYEREGSLILNYTNRIMGIEIALADIQEGFKPFSVSYGDFEAICKGLKDDQGTFRLDIYDEQISLVLPSEVRTISIPPYEAEALPIVPDIELIPIDTDILKKALPPMLKVVQADSPRNYGTVGHIDVGKDSIDFVGTDGFRLVRTVFKSNAFMLALHDVNISLACLKSLYQASLTGYSSLDIGVSEDRSLLSVKYVDTSIYFRLPSVKYPAYKLIIPQKACNQEFEVKALLAVFRSALRTTDKTKAVKISEKDGYMFLESGLSQYRHDLPEAFRLGKPVILNAKFVVDFLASVKGSKTGMIYFPADPLDRVKMQVGACELIVVPIKEED